MDRHTLIVCEGIGILRLRRARSEYGREVGTGVLDLHVRGSRGAHIAARSGEGHPWRRGVDTVRMIRIGWAAEQVIGVVEIQVSPIGECGLRLHASCRVFQVIVSRRRHTMTVRIDAGQDCDDVVRGVRDQRSVMIREKHAIVLDEVEEVRHLLEVGRYWGRAIAQGVAFEMGIVEDDRNYVADLPARRLEQATSGTGCSRRDLRSCARNGYGAGAWSRPCGRRRRHGEEYCGSHCKGLAMPCCRCTRA